MQANNDITIAFGSPVKHSFHEAKYEQGYCSSSIDEDCGIASTDFETETKVKHASVDILQLLADTGNVTVSKASRVAWKRYENQTAIKRHRPCSRMFVESLIRDPLQDLMGPWNVSAGDCMVLPSKEKRFEFYRIAFVIPLKILAFYKFLSL